MSELFALANGGDEQFTWFLPLSRNLCLAGYLTHFCVVSRYTRNLLHSAKCGCPGLPSSSSASVNIPCPSLQSGHLVPPQPPHWRHGAPRHQLGHGGARGQGALLYSSDKLHRPGKHVTVNPLPPPTLPTINSAHRRLVPSIKQSAAAPARSSDNSISIADYEINHTNPDEKTGNETAEPIYAEIRAKEIKDDQPVKSSSEAESKQNKSEQNEQHQELSGKKEIEYWQITAKEVVKFRPCTETFIVRE